MQLSAHQFDVLKTAHKFQLELMSRSLGHEVPIPETITRVLSTQFSDLAPDDLRTFHNWRDVLDLAISPFMVRDTLKEVGNWTMAESLLCHHVWKRSPREPDRDKTDFLATHMFRHPPNPGDWDLQRRSSEDGPAPTPPFELALRKILGPSADIALTRNHRQLVAEFDYFRQDIEDFRHFDQMMDSGLIKRVREVKESLNLAMYHPHVLAIVASFNTCFGQCFDELFYAATRSIKSFAEKVQQEGGSSMSRVDGDVTVNQLADVEETKILETEYLKARDQFHSVSKFKKAVDNRRGREKPAIPVPHSSPASAPEASPSASPSPDSLLAIEESKLSAMQESIATLVKDFKPSVATTVIRVRHVSVGLLPAETEAYRTNRSNEKSYRADVARLLARIVALIARISGELADYRSKQSSAYLWKPHADSLACLLGISQLTLQHAQELHDLAKQRGLTEKASSIDASVQRLREHVQVIAATLDQLPQHRTSK